MDDLISRQAAIDALEREKTYCTAFRDGYTPINVFEKYNAGLTDGIKALKKLPSADVVEVVRCKDCRFECGDACLHALGLAAIESSDCYCAYGERKETLDGTSH